jgi:hypothetical protein
MSVQTAMDPVDDLAVKAELSHLLHSRARGADRFDPDLMRACHPADGTDNHGVFAGLMYDLIASVERAEREGPPCLIKQHAISNAIFERKGEDVFGESYHVAHESYVEDGVRQDYRIGGRYLDTFRRREGRWLIQHRDIVYDWCRIIPGTVQDWEQRGGPDVLLGARGSSDLLYQAQPDARGRLTRWRAPAGKETISMDRLQQLIDQQEITQLLYRRARAGDRADPELAHACYHPGATERHGEFDGLAADFIDKVSFTRVRPGSPIKGMFHFITNVLVKFESDTEAFVESYHVAWAQMTDGTDASVGGRYLDRVSRRDARWAISHRDVIFDWSRMEPETAKFWDKHPAKPFLFGKRGTDDPLYGYIGRGA